MAMSPVAGSDLYVSTRPVEIGVAHSFEIVKAPAPPLDIPVIARE